jgi:hypothetical protein
VVAFATEKEFTKATAGWPISRLVEVWNSFAGVPPFDDLKPVKKFTDRKTATTRIWSANPEAAASLRRRWRPQKPKAAETTRDGRQAPTSPPGRQHTAGTTRV